MKANKAYVKGQTDLIELNKQREVALTQLCVLLGESPENAKSLERSNFDDLNYNNRNSRLYSLQKLLSKDRTTLKQKTLSKKPVLTFV